MVVLGGGRFLMSEVPLYCPTAATPVVISSDSSSYRGNSLIKRRNPQDPTVSFFLWARYPCTGVTCKHGHALPQNPTEGLVLGA